MTTVRERLAVLDDYAEFRAAANAIFTLMAPSPPSGPTTGSDTARRRQRQWDLEVRRRDREATVLALRLCIAERLTLREVGEILGVGREYTRQIEAKGLRRLRHPSRRDRARALPYPRLVESLRGR